MIINPEPERLTREVFRMEAARHSGMITPWTLVQCLDCGNVLAEHQLIAQACPICDGRVKDLA